MYADRPDGTRLRQGDVVRGVYFPRYSYGSLSLVYNVSKDGPPEFENRAIVKAEPGLAVVISQCCEFNENKRNAFSLARLTAVSDMIRIPFFGFNLAQLVPAKYAGRIPLADLRRANVIDEEGGDHVKAVNVYLYESDGAVLTEPHVVDFTQVMSIRMEDRKRVQGLKALELDRQHREEFQLKLGYFYSRPAED